jgi:hypothetical protein
MVSTLRHHASRFLLPVVALIPLSEGPARAQARLQSRQNAQCQHNGAQATNRQQLSALRSAMQRSIRQLNALAQSGQMTPTQLQAAVDLQTALQQLNALQNVAAVSAQLQILDQQLRAASTAGSR